jgi:hypothetical protein
LDGLAAALEPMTALLREQLEHERARADRAEAAREAERAHVDRERQGFLNEEARARQDRAELHREIDAAQTALAAAEASAAELRNQLGQTRAQAEAALQEAVALKAAADAAGRGGRWARLRRAWRGG